MTTTKPMIYVVDDDAGMLRALTALLSTVGYDVSPFPSAADFLAKMNSDRHGCVVLDVRMPEMSGLELQQHMNRKGSILPVIFITGHGDIPMAVQAMKAGAFDFLQKPFRDQELIDRINSALKQDLETRQTLLMHTEIKRRAESLTPREIEVMAHIVDGHANKVIAIDLGISERTVEIHRSNVMDKMGARSVAHLVKMNLMIAGEK